MNPAFFKIIGWLSLSIIAGVWMCSCSQKPSNEMEGIIKDVLKEDQGVTIDFQPHPKVK